MRHVRATTVYSTLFLLDLTVFPVSCVQRYPGSVAQVLHVGSHIEDAVIRLYDQRRVLYLGWLDVGVLPETQPTDIVEMDSITEMVRLIIVRGRSGCCWSFYSNDLYLTV